MRSQPPSGAPEQREVRRLHRLPGARLCLRRQRVEQLVPCAHEHRQRPHLGLLLTAVAVAPAASASAPPAISSHSPGPATARAESKRWPSTPVLWMSGTAVIRAIATTAAPIAIRASPAGRERPTAAPQAINAVTTPIRTRAYECSSPPWVTHEPRSDGSARSLQEAVKTCTERSVVNSDTIITTAPARPSSRTTLHTRSSRRNAPNLLLRFSAVSGRGLPDSPVMRTATP